jgi:putative transposase
MDRHQDRYEVQLMCNTLEVSRSGFYAWTNRAVSPRRQRRRELLERIRRAHADSRGVYGSPRIHAELAEDNVQACVNTVARLMKQANIRSKIKRRFVLRTTDSNHDQPVMSNVLNRQFSTASPNAKWCCDITYVPTGQGFLYLAAVMDLCSRRIVGWSMADHLKTDLCMNALRMALRERKPAAGLLHHSDRGVQYASDDYRHLLEEHGITISMSRAGNCHDNAMMESFFGTLKTELIHHEKYATHEAARQSIFAYIEVFYNRRRRHSAIGYQSPEQFEASLN